MKQYTAAANDRSRDTPGRASFLQLAGRDDLTNRWSDVEPEVGIEPTTDRLQGGRSALTVASTCDHRRCLSHKSIIGVSVGCRCFAPRLMPRGRVEIDNPGLDERPRRTAGA